MRTLRFGERCQTVTLGAVRRVASKKDKTAEAEARVAKLQVRQVVPSLVVPTSFALVTYSPLLRVPFVASLTFLNR